MKNSFITVTDQFCGAGGSSQGARELSRSMDLDFNRAGFSVGDLVRIQIRINKTYSRTVSKVLLGDTCYSLTDRFNAKQ